MPGYFRIGMTKSEALAKLGTTQATETTKQYIKNFWNTDRDGKITNEIELTMLESWANGSEKVKMPAKGKGSKPVNVTVFDNGRIEHWESNSNTGRIAAGTKNYDRLSIWKDSTMESAEWNDGQQTDTLYDLNNDGYADYRDYSNDKWSPNPTHKDTKLDGNLKAR